MLIHIDKNDELRNNSSNSAPTAIIDSHKLIKIPFDFLGFLSGKDQNITTIEADGINASKINRKHNQLNFDEDDEENKLAGPLLEGMMNAE